MGHSHSEVLARRDRYLVGRGTCAIDALGSGVQGSVWSTAEGTAVKVLQRERPYRNERDVYLRLREHRVTQVRGCAVPELFDHDDALWVIEMTIVAPPYVLDFATAYLDHVPDFPSATLEVSEAEKRERFGARWPGGPGHPGHVRAPRDLPARSDADQYPAAPRGVIARRWYMMLPWLDGDNAG